MKLKLLVSNMIMLLFFIVGAFGANVNLDIELNKYNSNYKYNIDFKEQNVSYFSFEISEGSKITKIRSENENYLNYNFKGDEVEIINSQNSKKIEIEIEREYGYLTEGKFANYLDFSFIIENLTIKVNFEKDFVYDLNKIQLYPRENKILQNSIEWNIENLERETLLFIDIREILEDIEKLKEDEKLFEPITYLLFLISVPIILFVILISYILLKKEINKSQVDLQKTITKRKKESIEKKKIKEKIKEDSENFSNTINKFLTENEKDIVNLIREHEGITQLDILSFLPNLTKSNLSKIITKLHKNKFLLRVRVGKENRIHLGEKLKNSK